MNYFKSMLRILKMDTSVYNELAQTGRPIWYCMINITLLGLIYGCSCIFFAQNLLDQQSVAATSFNPVMILLVGISIAFIMHAGMALFIWVFCRGIGGCQDFMPPYLNIGIAGIALWPLAPALSMMQVLSAGTVATGYAVIAAIYGLTIMFMAVKAVAGLSNLKMTLAGVGTIIYIGCFLYLWT